MASKYLNIKDNKKRQIVLKKESNSLARKTTNIISGRINYFNQPLILNNILLKNSLFYDNNTKNLLLIKKFNSKIIKSKKFQGIIKNLYKLEYNNNILIKYFNINKKLIKNSSFIRVKNRCIISGRSHAIHRLFKLSRIKLRELGSHGKLMGLMKASW